MPDEIAEQKRIIPLSPRVRRVVAAAILVAGVVLVGRVVTPVSPRDVELRMRLSAFRAPPTVARRVSVAFVRRGELVRQVATAFEGTPPLEWRHTLSIPPGEYDARVSVESADRVAVREGRVRIEAGAPVDLVAPPAP